MPKDLRKMMENHSEEQVNLSSNHQLKFEDKLQKELHAEQPKRTSYRWLSIAASVVILIGFGLQFILTNPDNPSKKEENEQRIGLGNISPELNTIETYYTNCINLELSELEITDQNQEILHNYLAKIKELANEYKSLTDELNTKGVNDETIDALISNLQLRLQLLKRLKKQLNKLKLNTKENEHQTV